MLAVRYFLVCCLNGGGVPGPCLGVYSRSEYKLKLLLVYDSVSCNLEDVNNESELSFDVMSIVLSVLGIYLCGRVWFGFGDFGGYYACLELAKYQDTYP